MNEFIENIDGNNIFYKRGGKGTTLLLIHGITTNSFIWKDIYPELSKHYDVIAVDLLGNGNSDKPLDVDYSIKNMAIIMHKFCDQLKIEKLHLICHDVGGGIGQIFMVNYPDRVLSLTLINSVAYDFWPVQPITTLRTPVIRQIAMATLDFGMLKIIVKRGLYHKEKCNANLMNYFWQQMSDQEGRKAFLHFAECLNNGNLLEIADKLAESDKRVLIIRGDEDVYLNKDITVKLHENLKNSTLKIIPTAGHFAMIDEPEIINEYLLEFLKQ